MSFITLPAEIVQLLSYTIQMIYVVHFTLPLGESSPSEERANAVCQWPVVTDATKALPGRSNVRPRAEGIGLYTSHFTLLREGRSRGTSGRGGEHLCFNCVKQSVRRRTVDTATLPSEGPLPGNALTLLSDPPEGG